MGSVFAFTTTIQHVSIKPNRLIFLNYPARIENRQLRTYQRERTHLPAQISPNQVNGKLTGSCLDGYYSRYFCPRLSVFILGQVKVKAGSKSARCILPSLLWVWMNHF